jgi:outer membrane protein assembly factor BamB
MDPSGAFIYITGYDSPGTRLSKLTLAGSEVTFRQLTGPTLTEAIPLTLQGGSGVLISGGSDGVAYGFEPLDAGLPTRWSRSLRRASCTADAITAPLVAQERAASDANFQALRSEDLVIYGTHYMCNTTISNKIYALNATNGNIVWTFNTAGTSQVDYFNGLAIDPSRNLAFGVTWKTDPARSQYTLWAIRTTNGTRPWALDLGAIEAPPVLANGGLYVASYGGTLYKLDPATGATLWQEAVPSGGAYLRGLSADGDSGRVYVRDSLGYLHAYDDSCSGAEHVWQTHLGTHGVALMPAILGGYLYVQTVTGRAIQVRASDGASISFGTIGSTTGLDDPLVIYDGVDSRLLTSSGGLIKKICIPWDSSASDKAFVPAVEPEALPKYAGDGRAILNELIAALSTPWCE